MTRLSLPDNDPRMRFIQLKMRNPINNSNVDKLVSIQSSQIEIDAERNDNNNNSGMSAVDSVSDRDSVNSLGKIPIKIDTLAQRPIEQQEKDRPERPQNPTVILTSEHSQTISHLLTNLGQTGGISRNLLGEQDDEDFRNFVRRQREEVPAEDKSLTEMAREFKEDFKEASKYFLDIVKEQYREEELEMQRREREKL